ALAAVGRAALASAQSTPLHVVIQGVADALPVHAFASANKLWYNELATQVPESTRPLLRQIAACTYWCFNRFFLVVWNQLLEGKKLGLVRREP
uniref:Uncharacterized protein n=1 Tax=Aegilops tauschii subsp. strangulata TaxID=200361 RepID=A0A453CRK7_AEGTS